MNDPEKSVGTMSVLKTGDLSLIWAWKGPEKAWKELKLLWFCKNSHLKVHNQLYNPLKLTTTVGRIYSVLCVYVFNPKLPILNIYTPFWARKMSKISKNDLFSLKGSHISVHNDPNKGYEAVVPVMQISLILSIHVGR